MARDPRDPSASPAGIAPQRAFWIGFRTLVILGEFGRFRVLCMRRELLKNITRMVVKLGTGVLTDARKQPDLAQMEQLVAQIAEQRRAGRDVVLVSSGAVGAGMGALGHEK